MNRFWSKYISSTPEKVADYNLSLNSPFHGGNRGSIDVQDEVKPEVEKVAWATAESGTPGDAILTSVIER